MINHDTKNLKKRYLIWLYKVNKEELDRIDRKFTQLDIDKLILKELIKSDKNKRMENLIKDFKLYIENKEKEGRELKYSGNELKPTYLFITQKLSAVEKAIVKEFGKKTLNEISALYEAEMTERILKSTEH